MPNEIPLSTIVEKRQDASGQWFAVKIIDYGSWQSITELYCIDEADADSKVVGLNSA